MTGHYWQPKDEQQLQSLCDFIRQAWMNDKYPVFSVEAVSRTTKQNKALHLYLNNLASALNDAGLDMRKVIKQDVDIPWSKDTAKQFLWKPVQKASLGIDSTRELTTGQVDEVYSILSRHMSQKFGVNVEFPSAR